MHLQDYALASGSRDRAADGDTEAGLDMVGEGSGSLERQPGPGATAGPCQVPALPAGAPVQGHAAPPPFTGCRPLGPRSAALTGQFAEEQGKLIFNRTLIMKC